MALLNSALDFYNKVCSCQSGSHVTGLNTSGGQKARQNARPIGGHSVKASPAK